MSKKCLYCYKPLPDNAASEFHPRCSKSFFGTSTPPVLDYSIEQMEELAKKVIASHIAVPGVQPKLSLTLTRETVEDSQRNRLTVIGALGGNYIFKPPSTHFAEMPANEHITMRMAEEVLGLKTVPSSLIRLKSGELAYITRRVDRTENEEKIHMLDMFQILEASDKYKGSMERIGKAIAEYSENTYLDLTEYFMLVVYCFATGNSDMHLKNFSMMQGLNKEWILAPAYDLLNVAIVMPEDTEELALPIEGKKRKLTLQHFITFGKGLGLNEKQLTGLLLRVPGKKESMFKWLDNSFLSTKKTEAYKQIIETRMKIFK